MADTVMQCTSSYLYFNDISLLKFIVLQQCLFLFSLLVHGLFECGVQNCLTNI